VRVEHGAVEPPRRRDDVHLGVAVPGLLDGGLGREVRTGGSLCFLLLALLLVRDGDEAPVGLLAAEPVQRPLRGDVARHADGEEGEACVWKDLLRD